MNVARYLFQSPSSSQVQIGRLDPTSKEEDSTSSSQSAVQSKTPEQWLEKGPSTVQNISPTVESKQLLDIYA